MGDAEEQLVVAKYRDLIAPEVVYREYREGDEYDGDDETEREELQSMPISKEQISDADMERLKRETKHLPFVNVMKMMDDFEYNVNKIIEYCKNKQMPKLICDKTEQFMFARSALWKRKPNKSVFNEDPLYTQFFLKPNIAEDSLDLVQYYQENKKSMPFLTRVRFVKNGDPKQVAHLKKQQNFWLCDLADVRREMMEERRLERVAEAEQRKLDLKNGIKPAPVPASERPPKRQFVRAGLYSPEPAQRRPKKARSPTPVNVGASTSTGQGGSLLNAPSHMTLRDFIATTYHRPSRSSSNSVGNQPGPSPKKGKTSPTKNDKQPLVKVDLPKKGTTLHNEPSSSSKNVPSTSGQGPSTSGRVGSIRSLWIGKKNIPPTSPATAMIVRLPQVVAREERTNDGKFVIRHIVKPKNPWGDSPVTTNGAAQKTLKPSGGAKKAPQMTAVAIKTRPAAGTGSTPSPNKNVPSTSAGSSSSARSSGRSSNASSPKRSGPSTRNQPPPPPMDVVKKEEVVDDYDQDQDHLQLRPDVVEMVPNLPPKKEIEIREPTPSQKKKMEKLKKLQKEQEIAMKRRNTKKSRAAARKRQSEEKQKEIARYALRKNGKSNQDSEHEWRETSLERYVRESSIQLEAEKKEKLRRGEGSSRTAPDSKKPFGFF